MPTGTYRNRTAAAPGADGIDVLARLRADHDRLRELCERLAAALDDPERRGVLFSTLRRELLIHTRAEERVLYELLRERALTRAHVLQADEEHALIEHMVDELCQLDADDERWPARLSLLCRQLTAHLREEEAEQFPRARRLLGPDRRRQLATRLELEQEVERRLLAQAHAGSESYELWTKQDLYARARQLEIAGRSLMRKDELIYALRRH